MSASFDDQLLRSVLSGSAPSSKRTMTKVGEIGGPEEQDASAAENDENVLSMSKIFV